MKGNMSNMVTDADKQLNIQRQRFDPGDLASTFVCVVVLSIDVWLCVCSRVCCGRISTLKYCNPYRCGSLGSPRLHLCFCEECIVIIVIIFFF